jgi:hypothetical protein
MPPEGMRRRRRFLRALSEVFPVDFEEREHGAWGELDAAVVIGGQSVAHEAPRIPVLRFMEPDAGRVHRTGEGSLVEFGSSLRIDARLRTRKLGEAALSAVSERLTVGVPLAWDSRGAVWTADPTGTDIETALFAPTELDAGEALRDAFRPGRFLGLLPLVHLLRRITEYDRWVRPGPRAVFLFDDPNLHWPSYGHIRFAELAEHARDHTYHVAFATVPLDGWLVHPRAARIFREARSNLSLTLHGNDHAYQEFAVPIEKDAAVSIVEQAIRRIGRLERRTGLRVSRVMVPPHGLCSDAMLDAMLEPGVEAICRAPVWWRDWTEDRILSARWAMADVSPAGAPVLGRHLLTDARARDEVTLNLYLDQPAILYGHHYDLADGYGLLAEAAAWLNGFEGLEWCSLEALVRTNFVTLREDDRLRVRLFTRRAILRLEPRVASIELELPEYDAASSDVLICDGRQYELRRSGGVVRASVAVASGTSTLAIELVRRERAARSARGLRPKALLRRGVGEMRDRVHPLVRRAGLESTLHGLETAYGRRARARVEERRSRSTHRGSGGA